MTDFDATFMCCHNDNGNDEADDDDELRRKKRCPLHRQIRNQKWSSVLTFVRHDPSLIARRNGVGWSSLILAIYHRAPIDVISEMLDLYQRHGGGGGVDNTSHNHNNNNDDDSSSSSLSSLLSMAVPTGDRLCLHFATRFCTSLDILRMLTEPYPRALLHKSTDGATPLDRAIYYRQDTTIVTWLEQATKREEAVYELEQYNVHLKRQIVYACEVNRIRKSRRGGHINNNNNNNNNNNKNGVVQQQQHKQHKQQQQQQQQQALQVAMEAAKFVIQVYTYTKEREMIGLFDNVMSYVGVHEIPREAKRKVDFVTTTTTTMANNIM